MKGHGFTLAVASRTVTRERIEEVGALPTRRIFMLVLIEVVAIEVALHGIGRPWLARHATDDGIKGDLAQAGLLAA